MLLALGRVSYPERAQIDRTLELLLIGQSGSGGWGPYPKAPPEAFDTALALLALSQFRNRPKVSDALRRGREYLEQTQVEDGSWPETTRPAGAESYAQRMSTAGWVLLALLETQ